MYTAQIVLLVVLFVGLAHSWDIVISAKNRLEFYTVDGDKKSTTQLNSRNLTAITYDEVHNILLYVDKQSDNDAICAYNISTSMEYKCYIERSGRNIQGLAFDPVTEILFFTDTKERSINTFSLKPGSKNDVNGNLLIKIDDGIPTDIVIDSCRGYMFWINTHRTPSTIERAQLNGSERVVIVNAKWNFDLHSLTIDHQAQKLYWKMYENDLSGYIYSADLDGKNSVFKVELTNRNTVDIAIVRPNALTVSKEILFSVSTCSSCTKRAIYRYSKPLSTYHFKTIIEVDNEASIGIATKDKIKDQFKGISECNQVLHDYETNKLMNKIVKDYYVGPLCVHGTKLTLNELSFCKCTPGYSGERCEVSVCENTYCFQGNCSITEQGLPLCRCNTGYSGERCEMYMCHQYCLNNGICTFNEEDELICGCTEEYTGVRCEVPLGVNNDVGAQNTVAPPCQCDGHETSRLRLHTNKTVSSNSSYSLAEGNITLADLLANWRKPVATINVFVEVIPNN